MSDQYLQTKIVSSLRKVFSDEQLDALTFQAGSALANEVYSFQVAFTCDPREAPRPVKDIRIRVESSLSDWVTVRIVDNVPVRMPNYGDHDDNILRATPGLYPDLLKPLGEQGLTVVPGQWHSLWVTVDPQGAAAAGVHSIEITFLDSKGNEQARESFELTIIDAELPEQKLIHTEWFHSDCLATWYNIDVFSEEHWRRIKQYMETAVKHGINMILTPVFTPPLDTEIGGERPTVQLVDVKKSGDIYSFGFEKLERWIDLCRSVGVEYFEFSHLFTQWGAKHTPKIMAKENGEEQRIFGWDIDADSDDYHSFLDQFLPELVELIKEKGLQNRSYFHVSDEPSIEHLESYKNASAVIAKHLNDFPVIDALSRYEFYDSGLVKNPIPATNHIEPFLENKLPDLWTYYCCGQYKQVSNRFIAMPSVRNRILGMQLYKFDIAGFLHWGYNFYYSQFSRYPIDPYKINDGEYWTPGGDPFLVYPGVEGPLESIRLEVFFEALQDIRALRLLESLLGRDTVLALLEEDLDMAITFSNYPADEKWLLKKREAINQAIANNIS